MDLAPLSSSLRLQILTLYNSKLVVITRGDRFLIGIVLPKKRAYLGGMKKSRLFDLYPPHRPLNLSVLCESVISASSDIMDVWFCKVKIKRLASDRHHAAFGPSMYTLCNDDKWRFQQYLQPSGILRAKMT
jgi:hypothetical protein